MAVSVDPLAAGVIVVFAIEATFGVMVILAAGIKAEEIVALRHHMARARRSTTRDDQHSAP